MAEDGGTYKISSEFLESFARDRINGQFLEQFKNDPYIRRLHDYSKEGGGKAVAVLKAGDPSSPVEQVGGLEARVGEYATSISQVLDGLRDGMLALSNKVLSVNHISMQGEEDAKDIALQSMMDDLREPLALFGGGGSSTTQPTLHTQPTNTGS
ncbi:hypothetical protein ACFVWY_28115 [Streptomyces sp. NPDC058195]|uniref:hypothetical protein n=1 Tax=Streptomyces sp. NPDC058195 TaxID=3346375 RepID=UPI0036E503C6